MKKVKGFFVIVIKQFDTTMFGADYHYTPWCLALDKYCRFDDVENMMKFNTYADAERYANETEADNTHDRILEIAYLTTHDVNDDAKNDALLCNWVQIKGEEDALNYDIKQAQHAPVTQRPEEKVPEWDTTKFSSLHKGNGSQINL